jgi:hypothetical protein
MHDEPVLAPHATTGTPTPDIVARSWRAVRAALADLDEHGR